jgi:hypothetical protein
MWIYFQKAEPTEATEKVLWTLEQYLIDQWQEPQMMWMNEQANSAANMMMWQASQNMNNNIVSKQNVLEPNQM